MAVTGLILAALNEGMSEMAVQQNVMIIASPKIRAGSSANLSVDDMVKNCAPGGTGMWQAFKAREIEQPITAPAAVPRTPKKKASKRNMTITK